MYVCIMYILCIYIYMAVCQNLVPLVNIKIAGKWMFIPLKKVLIGIDPYPYILYAGSITSLNLKLRQPLVIFTMPVLDHPSDANQSHRWHFPEHFFKGFFIGLHPTYQHYILYMCMDNIYISIYIYIPSGYLTVCHGKSQSYS